MTLTFVPLFPGIPGGPELLIVLLIVVLLFGANKLPQLARSSGQAMGEFKRGREEIDQELRSMSERSSEADDAESTRDVEEETDRTSAA
ncbi:twin-arginine translocation protein, TatA/E family subunit [Halogeometricum pallidum JCM 14848]|uniref:Sec-independent protein translocase protein TatA n=1 Tax=Halogeometricum pallidum JCM 14848 TaxID=1227487 RepID=M0CVW5_HALPD|nr:twin-arginine translocase TatA/TatE family subunit [Halogeometricum pallidum]ELZ26793.1 twin-arginine translocation protein, TatA/E family subunit [Halogeometricum pallidum JCM 14848]